MTLCFVLGVARTPLAGDAAWALDEAGHVLAARAGTPWEALLHERVTGPLGLASTRIAVAAADVPRFAVGHHEAGWRTAYWEMPAFEAAGALRSNVSDLVRLVDAALHERAPFAADFFVPQLERADERHGVGYGWFRRRGASGDYWWHNGGTGGFRSFVGVMPARGVGVIALSNSAISVDELAAELLGDLPRRTPAGGNSPVLSVICALLALLVLARLAFFRFAPPAAQGARRWLRADQESIAGFGALVLEAVAIGMALIALAPLGGSLAPLRWGFAALLALLLAVAVWRFARAARARGPVRWMPTAVPRWRAAAGLALKLAASAAVLAFVLS